MSTSHPPRILDVGNCDPDHRAMRDFLTREFAARVDRVMFVPEALGAMRAAPYDLVLVNRRIFADDSDGLALVRAAGADAALAQVPVMLISNFPAAQAAAAAAGAVAGFGKAALATPAARAAVAAALAARAPA